MSDKEYLNNVVKNLRDLRRANSQLTNFDRDVETIYISAVNNSVDFLNGLESQRIEKIDPKGKLKEDIRKAAIAASSIPVYTNSEDYFERIMVHINAFIAKMW